MALSFRAVRRVEAGSSRPAHLILLRRSETQRIRPAHRFVPGERMSQPVAPPGWYPDPSGVRGKRYWDGSAWASPFTAGVPAEASVFPGRRSIWIVAVAAVLFLGGCVAFLANLHPEGSYTPPPGVSDTDAAFLREIHGHGITNDGGDTALIRLAHGIWGPDLAADVRRLGAVLCADGRSRILPGVSVGHRRRRQRHHSRRPATFGVSRPRHHGQGGRRSTRR